MTSKKTVKCTTKTMKSCEYGTYMGPELYGCQYILMEGKRRGCSPDCCDKYKKRKGNNSCYTKTGGPRSRYDYAEE